MNIIHDPAVMQKQSREYAASGKRVSFVPTMGALHEGHLSLLDRANSEGDITVVSVFVNPTQFGPGEDYDAYPRTLETDCAAAQERGCDIMFAPPASAMYPEHFSTTVTVGSITEPLCGASRPGHFAGVTTVVTKLLNIVQPDCAIFGQKDAQQFLVVRRMVRDLNIPVTLIASPIVREDDGLALSSRNRYLTPDERAQAPALFRGLQQAVRLYKDGLRDCRELKKAIIGVLDDASLIETEYVEAVDTIVLHPREKVTGPTLCAVAVRTKETCTRLIDNTILGGSFDDD